MFQSRPIRCSQNPNLNFIFHFTRDSLEWKLEYYINNIDSLLYTCWSLVCYCLWQSNPRDRRLEGYLMFPCHWWTLSGSNKTMSQTGFIWKEKSRLEASKETFSNWEIDLTSSCNWTWDYWELRRWSSVSCQISLVSLLEFAPGSHRQLSSENQEVIRMLWSYLIDWLCQVPTILCRKHDLYER
jgi:hypothetical protein